MSDWDVIWNGAHQHADRDLLCTQGVPEKRSAPALSADPVARVTRGEHPSMTRVKQALLTQPLSVGELRARTGLTYCQVQNVLYKLRSRGELKRVQTIYPKNHFGRWPSRYALVEAA